MYTTFQADKANWWGGGGGGVRNIPHWTIRIKKIFLKRTKIITFLRLHLGKNVYLKISTGLLDLRSFPALYSVGMQLLSAVEGE